MLVLYWLVYKSDFTWFQRLVDQVKSGDAASVDQDVRVYVSALRALLYVILIIISLLNIVVRTLAFHISHSR